MLYHTLNIVNLRIRTQGRKRKEDGKRCVTSVTIKMFEKRFHQTSPSSEQKFCKNQDTITLSVYHTKTSK